MMNTGAGFGLGTIGLANAYPSANMAPSNGVQAPTAHMARSAETEHGWRTAVDPHNPVLWLGVIVAAAVGLAGLAGSARLGPIKVSGSVGKS